MTTSIRPLQDYVLIQRQTADDRSAGGIIIPDNAKERPARGKVLAVGPGKVTDAGVFVEVKVKKDDLVLFGKYAPQETARDTDAPVLVRESEILAVIDG